MNQDKPPIFNSWKGWYITVFAVLVAEILLFLWITNSFK
jgi:hypothetical protein